MKELYKVYRPKTLDELLGQERTVKILKTMLSTKKVPHAILLCGDSGCGKTTLARILRKELGCHSTDFLEINAADVRGIDTIRDIKNRMYLSARNKSRIWLIDEAHKLTNDAQNAFLKMLEDTPDHVYFILATTDPNKLIKTIRTRCSKFELSPLNMAEMRKLINGVLEKEGKKLSDTVKTKLIETIGGGSRAVLTLLEQIIQLDDEKDALELIQKGNIEKQAFDLARILINPKSTWQQVCPVLKDLKEQNQDAETIRRVILGYGQSVLLGGGGLSARAFAMIEYFSKNYYDIGFPGLVSSCYSFYVD